MYMPIKYILQKDVPERMSESNFGLKYLRNNISLVNIQHIFDKRMEPHGKPSGFWYSLKWYWLDNTARDYYYHDIDYSIDPNRKYYVNENWFLYDIQIEDETFTHIGGKKGLDKVIQIRNQKDITDFYEEYKYLEDDDSDDDDFEKIDWRKVYMDYGGIELAVPHLEKYINFNLDEIEKDDYRVGWFYGWDVASGCIWNGDVVKKIRWIL